MRSLELLRSTKPSWVSITSSSLGKVNLSAAPPNLGGASLKAFHLKMAMSGQHGVKIQEQVNYRQLPDCCPERHINSGGTFCLYYGSEKILRTNEEAEFWWCSLSAYLNNQMYADKYELWPLEAGLSHGEAALLQIDIEKLAEPLGWKDEILRSMFRNEGWLATNLPRVNLDAGKVYNLRSGCPRQCNWKHKLMRSNSCGSNSCYASCQKQHKPIVRRDCPHKDSIEEITLLEHRRQLVEKKFIQELLNKNKQCCGTMKICPLRY